MVRGLKRGEERVPTGLNPLRIVLSLVLAAAPAAAAFGQSAPPLQPPSRPSGGGGSGVEIDEGALAAGLLSWAVRKKREADAKKKAEEAARQEAEARAAAEAAAAPPPPTVAPSPVAASAPTEDRAAGLPAGPQPYRPAPRATPRPVPAAPAAPRSPPLARPAPVVVPPAPIVATPQPTVAAPPTPPAAPAPAPAAVAAGPVPPLSAAAASAQPRGPRQALWPWLVALLAVAAAAGTWATRRYLGWGVTPPYVRAGLDAGEQDAPDFGDLTMPTVALHVSPGAFESDLHFHEAAE